MIVEELKVDFYERIRSQIKDYLPAEGLKENQSFTALMIVGN